MDMTDDPYWSESSWFSWAIPERGINGFFYNHFRPNMNCLLGGPAMWDRSGQHVWDFLYFDWQLMRRLPRGRYGVDYNKYDFETPWSMAIKMIKPLERYQLRYDREGFKLDLVFTAISPPNEVGQHERGAERAYKLHFEQPGRIEGTVELDGECYSVNCFSIRDGSHGPRFLETTARGGYAWSTWPMPRPGGTCSRGTTRGVKCRSSAAISCATARSRPSLKAYAACSSARVPVQQD